MTDAKAHYDVHLGPIYEWMAGPFETACIPSIELFEELGLDPFHSQVALDLGCGHGLQSLPLAQRGYQVIAVDTCSELLEALACRTGDLSIRILEADITRCWDEVPSDLDVVVCMGDTLTHLGSLDEVTDLVERGAAALTPGGLFVSTFRDYVSAPLEGDQRFVPVRSDEDRILTCFLEVRDILHERSGSNWNMSVSSYDKLRLDPLWISSLIRDLGFEIIMEKPSVA